MWSEALAAMPESAEALVLIIEASSTMKSVSLALLKFRSKPPSSDFCR